MIIHKNFIGGNIEVTEQTESDVYLKNEIRDTMEDWFYWAFCVEGAQGKTVTFHFQHNRLGYFGPAVSHDLDSWHWLGSVDGDTFTYQFGKDEDKVYFAHHILYNTARFDALAERVGCTVEELCKSRKGRSVPCIRFGEGKVQMILTSRHHACESTGTYVLEGVIEELAREPVSDISVLCVPFVDCDGVFDGDQGKARFPHDHNRDYTDEPIYPETAAIIDHANKNGCNFALDFHSPWHKGGMNDTIFVVRNREDRAEQYDRFAELLEGECGEDTMAFKKENFIAPKTDWNQPSANFAYTMHCRPECKLGFTFETAYFGTQDNVVSASRLVALGRAYAKALKKYVGENL